MKEGQFAEAAAYWDNKDALGKRMPRADVLAAAEAFIRAHNTCALATGTGTFVRCTPIEYNYMDGCFWLLSEGGRKFTGLAANRNVSLAIYEPYTGFGTVAGMQVTGTAELVEAWSPDYLALLAYKKIPAEALKKQPGMLHLIKITPSRIDMLSAAFKKAGFDNRQHVEF